MDIKKLQAISGNIAQNEVNRLLAGSDSDIKAMGDIMAKLAVSVTLKVLEEYEKERNQPTFKTI